MAPFPSGTLPLFPNLPEVAPAPVPTLPSVGDIYRYKHAKTGETQELRVVSLRNEQVYYAFHSDPDLRGARSNVTQEEWAFWLKKGVVWKG